MLLPPTLTNCNQPANHASGTLMNSSRTAPHRTLALHSLADLQAELDHLASLLADNNLSHSATWTPGQNFEHVGIFIKSALDGFEASMPAPLRFLARIFIKPRALGPDPMPRGIKLPNSARSLLPRDNISDAEGLAFLQHQLRRLHAGERMTHPSPLFGPLTHDQWLTIQLKHAALHLGFLHARSEP